MPSFRTAVGDEADFFALVATAVGIRAGGCGAAGRSLTRVVVENGRIAGFGRVVRDARCTHGAELEHLFVNSDCRGRGLGRALLHDLVGAAALLGHPQLRVAAHPPAERFLRRGGGHRVGTAPPATGVPWSRPLLHLHVDQLCAPDARVLAAERAAARTS